MIDVLELATLTQDLVVFAPPPLLDGLIDGVKRVHGILHLLFHPAHLHRPEVRDVLKTAIDRAKREGMEWWTARQINAWERARRGVSWSNFTFDGISPSATDLTTTDLFDATSLFLTSKARVSAAGPTVLGFNFAATTQTIRGNTDCTIGANVEPA